MKRILFAGGGTAGHIEPALATAKAWQSKYPEDQISFLGTSSGLETKLIPSNQLLLIPKVTAPRKISFSAIISLFKFVNSLRKTLAIVNKHDAVVGFGGYVAAPAYLAAAIARKPLIIHEANAKPGIANRFGAKFTKQIAVGYELAKLQLKNAKLVGNPLRQKITESANQSDWALARNSAKARVGAPADLPMILILGGSQGAKTINEVIKNANFANYFVLHSVGSENDLPKSTNNYHPVSYISEMADALLAADLIISRSGAIACAEIAALGRFALFIPLPIGNGEQALNAQELINAGRAELVQQNSFNNEWLASNLPNLMQKALKTDVEPIGTKLNAAQSMVEMIEGAIK